MAQKIEMPEPSWQPIRKAPLYHQAAFASPGKLRGAMQIAPLPLARSLIIALLESELKVSKKMRCGFDKHTDCLFLRPSPSTDSENDVYFHPWEAASRLPLSKDGRLLASKIKASWTWMEARFRRALQHDYCRLWVRRGSPSAPTFTEVPGLVFANYRISDWRRGSAVAESDEGDRFHDLYVEGLRVRSHHYLRQPPHVLPERIETSRAWSALEQDREAITLLFRGVKGRTRDIAAYFCKHPSQQPAGDTITKTLRDDVAKALKLPGRGENLIDPRTILTGLQIARDLRDMGLSSVALKACGFSSD